MAKMGRPKKEISQKRFEVLCACQATLVDICDELEVTDKTLNNWCKEVYGKTFSEVFKQKRKLGLNSLRGRMYKAAMDGDRSVMIFLAKNWLGMSDKVENVNYNVDAKTIAEVEEMVRGE